jgi:hypothetical protein
MSIMELGALGEFFGSIAVLATLVYLGVQIRKQTQEARFTATRELASEFHTAVNGMAHDKELMEIYSRGIRDYLALPEGDRLRLSFWLIGLFRILEQQHLHTTHGTVDERYFSSLGTAFVEVLSFTGVQSWWELSKGMFDDGFRAHVDRLSLHAKGLDYQGSFKWEGSTE